MRVGDVYANRRTGAMVEILALPEIAGPGAVRLRRLFRPGMGFRLPHLHLVLDETFCVETGVADFRIGHRRTRLSPGERIRIPRYEVHVGPLNRSSTDLVFVQTMQSARTGALVRYVETLGEFISECRDDHGDLPPLVAAAIFAGKDQQTFVPWIPRGLQRDVLFPLARTFEDRREQRRRLRDAERLPTQRDHWAD